VVLQHQNFTYCCNAKGPLSCRVSERIFSGREDTVNQSVLFLWKGLWSVPPNNFFPKELNSWWALQTPGEPDAFYHTRTSMFTFTQPTQVTEPSDKEYRAVRHPTTVSQVGKCKTKNYAVLCYSASWSQQVDHSKLITASWLYTITRICIYLACDKMHQGTWYPPALKEDGLVGLVESQWHMYNKLYMYTLMRSGEGGSQGKTHYQQ